MLWVWEKFISYTVEKFCHRNSGTRQTKSGKLPARGWKLLERKNNQRFCLGFWGEKVGLIFQAAAVMKRENGMQQVIITLPCESLLWEQVLPGDHLPYFSSSSPPPCPDLLLHACLSSLLPVSLPSQCLQQCSVPVLFFPQSRSLLSGASPQNVESLGKEIRIWGFKWHLSK